MLSGCCSIPAVVKSAMHHAGRITDCCAEPTRNTHLRTRSYASDTFGFILPRQKNSSAAPEQNTEAKSVAYSCHAMFFFSFLFSWAVLTKRPLMWTDQIDNSLRHAHLQLFHTRYIPDLRNPAHVFFLGWMICNLTDPAQRFTTSADVRYSMI